MTPYVYTPGSNLELTRWQLTHDPARGEATPLRTVTVPHSAMRDMVDVRAGGTMSYEAQIVVGEPEGTETLFFDSAGPDVIVEVNGVECARRVGLWAAFSVPIGAALHAGENTVRVTVTVPDYEASSPHHYRNMLLGIVPDVEGAFAGIWQKVHLRAAHPTISDVRVDLDHQPRDVVVTYSATSAAEVRVEICDVSGTMRWASTASAAAGEVRVACPGAEAWTPASPQLYRLRVVSVEDGAEQTLVEQSFGFRSVSVQGKYICFDNAPVYLRGALHWGFYNAEGIPYADPATTRAELEQIKAMGFNTVKICLFIAAQHFYDICDELGLVVWQELPLWLPGANDESSRRVEVEYPRIVEQLKRHPSLAIISLGCELDASISTELLDREYARVHTQFPGIVVCANSGSGEMYGGGTLAESDIYDYHFYGDIQHVERLYDHFTHIPRQQKPWLFGEFNDSDTWRTQPAEGDGFWLSDDFAKNPLRSIHAGFDSDQPVYHQHQIIAAEGYADELDGLEELSLRQSHTTRKLQWELTYRSPAISGYMISEFRDTLNTAVGVADVNGVPKYSLAELQTVNSEVVLTIESPLDRRWIAGGDRLRTTDVYNATAGESFHALIGYGNTSATHGEARLRVTLHEGESQTTVAEQVVQIEPFHAQTFAEIAFTMPAVTGEASSHRRMEAVLQDASGVVLARNEWEMLAHPAARTGGLAAVYDPGEMLGDPEDVAAWLGGPRITDLRELAQVRDITPLLITTEFDERMRRELVKHGMSAFIIGGGFFSTAGGSFWRENVKRIHDTPWVRSALPVEWAGTPLVSIGSDRSVRRSEIREKVGDFTPHITRYDTRKYTVGEYLFSWTESDSLFTYSSLTHGGGSGPQPSLASDSLLSRRLIDVWMANATNAPMRSPQRHRKEAGQ